MQYSHSTSYRAESVRLYRHMLLVTPPSAPWIVRLLSWAVIRLETAEASNVMKYISMVKQILKMEHQVDLSQDDMLPFFVRALQRLAGVHRVHSSVPLTKEAYTLLISKLTFPFNAIVALAWRRAARVADILEMRQGGIWTGLINEALMQAEQKLRQISLTPKTAGTKLDGWESTTPSKLQ